MNDFQKADLTEEFMPLAMQIAAELDNGTVPLEDLTQEAFLGLVAGLNLVAESDERGEGLPLDRTVEQAIREQVLLALAEQEDYMKSTGLPVSSGRSRRSTRWRMIWGSPSRRCWKF